MTATVRGGAVVVGGVAYRAPQLAALEGRAVGVSPGLHFRVIYPPHGDAFEAGADADSLAAALAPLRARWNRELARRPRREAERVPR